MTKYKPIEYPPTPTQPTCRHHEPGEPKPWASAVTVTTDHYHYGVRAYGVLDVKGRETGGYASISIEILTDREAKTRQVTGRWITRMVATRDGKGFGAIAKEKAHATNAAAEAWAEKALARQAKRYITKFG